jgi:CBS domain-containing protein
MRISEILKKKSNQVFTISPKTTVKEAARLFRERKIGAAPVVNPGPKVIGLLTERDVLHGIADYGSAVLDMEVDKLMTQDVYSCTPDDGYHQVMHLMSDRHVRHVLVIVEGKLEGIVSVGDMMKNRLDESQMEINVMRDYTHFRMPHG